MACSGCQKKKAQELQLVQRQRNIIINNTTGVSEDSIQSQESSQINLVQQPASEKFQIPRILPPLTR